MPGAKGPPASSFLLIVGATCLLWFVSGPLAAGMTLVGIVVFVGFPFWLAAVYGKPPLQRPH